MNYSMGMKKKLGMICALLHRPELLILDEPTNGLDPFATRTLIDIVRQETEAGVSVFYSTHLLDQAERLCDRVAILRKGDLVRDSTIDELRDALAPGGSLEDVFLQVAGDRADEREPESPEDSM